MKPTLELLPCISISPSKIYVYNEVIWTPYKPCKPNSLPEYDNSQSKTDRIINSSRSANGIVSINARKKISTALDYLLVMSKEKIVHVKSLKKKVKFKIAFITLTLPSQQIHSDLEIKQKCLNSLLIELTKYHNVTNYIWRAEKQKNGNLHFHIIIDQFVLYNELNKRWNRICNKLGYVDRYQQNMKQFHSQGFHFNKSLSKNWSYENQLKAYKSGVNSDWRSPNSTDIHSVKYIKNIKSYISKYLTKQPETQQSSDNSETQVNLCSGRLWSCNTNLSDIKNARSYIDYEISEALSQVCAKSQCKRFSDTYYSVYYISIDQLKILSPDCLFLYFARYMAEHFNFNMQLCT